MTIYRINPDLLKPEGASDGDVITYVSANSRVEWAAPTGGGGDVANAWVNANDYATYISITSNLNSVNSNVDSVAANAYNTYTTLTANDYNSYTTLTANIYNTFAYLNANVGGGGGGDVANVWVNANDYNTYTTLSGFIDTVQDNIASLYGTTLYQGLDSDVFLLDSSTNSFSLSYSVASNNDILVSVSGVVQTPDQYVIASNVLTISNTTPLPANVYLEVRKLFPGVYDEANVYDTYTTLTANIYNTFEYLNANVGGGGGITTGKAIAMAMIFGG